MTAHVRDAGVWKEITSLHVRDAGVWKTATEGHVRDGSVWKQFLNSSDPITIEAYPIWTASYQEPSPYAKAATTFTDPDSDVIQGDWDGVGVALGMERATGIMRWNVSDLNTALGGRSVVSLIRLRLKVRYEYTSFGIHPRIVAANNTLDGSAPANLNGTTVRTGTVQTGARTNVGNTVWVTLPVAWGNSLLAGTYRGFCGHDVGTSNASKELYRGGFYGLAAAAADRPMLEITADY